MVNIAVIIYIRARRQVVTFSSAEQFRQWQINRCQNQNQKDEFINAFYRTFKAGERYLELKHKLRQGTMTDIHHVFLNTNKASGHLRNPEILEALSGEHIVVLELNPTRQYVMVNIYAKKKSLAIKVDS